MGKQQVTVISFLDHVWDLHWIQYLRLKCLWKQEKTVPLLLICIVFLNETDQYLGSEAKLIPGKLFESYTLDSKSYSLAECNLKLDYSCMYAMQCVHCSVWFSTTGEKRVEKANEGVFYSKSEIFLCESVQTAQPNPYMLNGIGYFPNFLLRISLFVAASRIP